MNNIDLCILKSITTNKKQAIEFVNENSSSLFSTDYWTFANLIINYIKTYKDVPTLKIISDKLSKNEKQLENVKKIWQELDSITYDKKEFKHDLEKIKKRYAEKELLSTKNNLAKLESGSIDISKTVSDLQKTIQNIKGLNQSKAYQSKSVKDYLPQFVDKFNAKRDNPNIETGIKTGYAFFDYATNGIKAADFILIAGESGFGKSLLLNNFAIQIWLQNNDPFSDDISSPDFKFKPGKSVIYYSIEMPYEDCFNRFLSRLSGVPSRNIENAILSKEDSKKVKKCLDFISKYPYQFKIVDIAEACSNDLEIILTEDDEKFDVAFVDYLGILKTNNPGNEEQDWLKQGVISQELRAIARKFEIPIFSAVQLNRKSNNKEPAENIGLNRLARSATIATHATHVLQIESRTNEEKFFDFVVHIIKNRKGPKNKGILIKNLACGALLDKKEDDGGVNNYDDLFTNQDDISDQIGKLEL